jgi:glutamate synthase (ferredoxin)
VERSGSGLGQEMLSDWPKRAAAFVRLTPKPQA